MGKKKWLLAGGAMAFWKFGIDRNMMLPPAISAEKRTISSSQTGLLNYYVDKSGDGRPLLLIHSINAAPSSYEMRPLFDHYRGKRPVYALDLPGFGFSERSDRAYSIDLFVSAILFMLREIGESADIIALSLGSEFAAGAALRHPELVNSLTLITPTGLRKYSGQPPSAAIYRTVTFPLLSQPLYDTLTSKQSIRFFLAQSFEGDPHPGMLDYAYRTSHQPGARNAPYHFLSGQLFNYDVLEAVYKKLLVPTLVLYDKDPNVSFDELPAVIASNMNWQAKKIVPTKGLPHWEQLEKTVAALEAFWS